MSLAWTHYWGTWQRANRKETRVREGKRRAWDKRSRLREVVSWESRDSGAVANGWRTYERDLGWKNKKKKNPNGYTRYDGRYFILSKKPAKKTFVREALDHPSITFEKLISSPCILSSLSRLSVGGKWINFIQDPPYKYMIMYKVVDILMNNSTSRCATHVPSLYRDA